MVNLDVVGIAGQLDLIGNDDLIETARIAGNKTGIDSVNATLPPGASSDHVSFQKAGVPVLMLSREDNLIHTPDDAIGRVASKSLEDAVTVALATLDALNPG
jgi:Iap family predicted aminopeptidase